MLPKNHILSLSDINFNIKIYRTSNEDLYSSRKEKILKTFSKLSDLYSNFIDTATIYGKIIISERNLTVDQKTIKPANELGGIAGNYPSRGIFDGSLFVVHTSVTKNYIRSGVFRR